MYESPIMVNVTDPIFESINKAQDEYVIRACQKIRADINQEELIKALQYDRSQYEKGYADGLAYKPPVETNADRIRSMTDEELAEFFTPFYYDGPKFYCPAQADVGEGECAAKSDCRQCWLDWLREEAEE